MAAFVLLALAVPVANAAPCSITWNITNDGRTGHYAYPFSAADNAACVPGGSPYTSPDQDIGDWPAEGGGTKGVDWQTPSNTLFYTPPIPAFTGTKNVTWYDVLGAPISVTINMTAGPPTVSSVSPAYGPTWGGQAVTITGTNLSDATLVKFGAVTAAFAVIDPTSIAALVPSNPAGTVHVTVTNAAGTSATGPGDQYTYIPAPTISSIAPNSGPSSGGTSVTIIGLGFTGATDVTFGGNTASFTVNSDSLITATSPMGSGTVDIRVTTPAGISATSASDQFTYTVSAPTVSGVAPNSGPASGGTAVTIAGTGFTDVTTVKFGAAIAGSFTINSPTSITATSPVGSPGTVDITVTTLSGTSATSAADQFTYGSPPPVAGAASVTVAYGSSSNPVTLNLSGGAATSVAVGVQAMHGTATAAGTTITYTPIASYAGADTFTYTATNSGGTSAPATVSITVTNPTISYSPSSPPPGTAGSAYSQSLASASGGAAPYTYSLVPGSDLPLGMSLTLNGTLTGTPTEAGTFNFIVRAQDSSTGGGVFLGDSGTLTLVISPPTLAMSPSNGSAFNGNVGSGFSQSFTVSGGVAPYQFSPLSVVSGTVPAGLAFNAATGTLSGAPTSAGTVTFQITGSDSTTGAGSTPVTQTYTLTVAAPTLGLSPPALPDAVQDTPYSQALTTSGGSAPYSYAVTTGALPRGLTLSPGGQISGKPTTTGTFSFTITATDSHGFTTSRGYTVEVNPAVPMAGPISAIVPWNTATPIDLTMVITGGAASSVAVTTPPGHGTVTISGSVATYTPAPGYAGTDSFTYTATNVSGSSAAVVSLTVNPQAPVAGAKSVTVAFNAATPIDLASDISGGTPTSIAVSTQPDHGTVTVSGTTVTYTPSAGYSGTDSFSYTATNAGGTSAAAVVSLTINPQVPVANNVATTFTTGSSDRFTIPLDIGGGAATAVTIVTSPAHGTVTVNGPAAPAISGGLQPAAVSPSGFSVTYVPNAGYVGTDSFTYTATNAGGSSTPATVSLQLNPPAPTVAPLSVTTVSGAPITIDVATRASGGPFTALAIDSQPTEGKTVLQGLGIVYTPAPTFVGTATIAYRLSNAYGTTQGTVTVTVNARLDPSRDPEVNGLVAAQADAARRFATAQLGNFNRRLERLHGNGWAGSGSTVNVSAYGVGMTLTPSGVQPTDLRNTRSDGATTQPVNVANEADRATVPVPAKAAAATDGKQDRLGFWIDGRIDLGQRDATTHQSDFDFRTDGISFGADYRLNDLASVGVGGGYARDESDVGSNGSKSTGTAGMVAIYGSLRPAQNWFVDGVLGYGALDFDLDRYVTDTGDIARASRQGDQFFGSLATGYEYRDDTWLVSPYGRVDAMTTSLDAFTESAAGVSALRYNEQTVRMTTGTLGVRGEMLFDTHLGNVVPRARFEYRHHFEGADNARLAYADLVGVGPVYLVSPAQTAQNQFVLGLGGTLILRSNWAISLDYDSTLNNDAGYSQSIGARLDVPF